MVIYKETFTNLERFEAQSTRPSSNYFRFAQKTSLLFEARKAHDQRQKKHVSSPFSFRHIVGKILCSKKEQDKAILSSLQLITWEFENIISRSD